MGKIIRFSEYQSISGTHSTKGYSDMLNRFYYNGYQDLPCVAEEKVHGANFSILYKDGWYDVASRRDLISKNEIKFNKELAKKGFAPRTFDFYGNCYKKLIDSKLLDSLAKIQKDLKAKNGIVLVGELCGGKVDISYKWDDELERDVPVLSPHYDPPVQKQLNYGIRQQFYWFDLFSINEEGWYNLIDPNTRNELFTKVGIKPPRILKSGTLQELVEYYIIPDNINIKNFTGDDFIEGVVIKSVDKEHQYNGAKRIILKILSEDSRDKLKRPSKRNAKADPINLVDSDLLNTFRPYLTEFRIEKVVGNMGYEPTSTKDLSKVLGEIFNDCMKDYWEAGNIGEDDKYSIMTKRQQKRFKNMVNSIVAPLVRKRYHL